MPLPVALALPAVAPAIGKGLLYGGAAFTGLDLLGRASSALSAEDREKAERQAEALQLEQASLGELLLNPTEDDSFDFLGAVDSGIQQAGPTQADVRALAQEIEARSQQLSDISVRSFPTPAELLAAAGI